eukprot:181722-Alexandrium_andersonii.AAC.1
MPGTSSPSIWWARTAGQRSSGFSVSRAVATAMSSASRCSFALVRTAWAEASVPVGATVCVAGAPL